MERINKVLARSTGFSRRDIDRLIDEGAVEIDGKKILSKGCKINVNSKVKINQKIISLKRDSELNSIYLFHKPRGCLVTKSDPKNRKTIYDFLKKNHNDLLSVGRLDYNTEGLLLLTNNGELKRKLELPSSNLERVYKVKVQGTVDNKIIQKLALGYRINNFKYKPIKAYITHNTKTYTWLMMTLTEGKNREIRNIFESLNLTVTRLIRVSYGKYKLGNLSKGIVKNIKL